MEKIGNLDGVRVGVTGEESTGTICRVYIDYENRKAEIHVSMDSGGLRCFRPYHLYLLNENTITSLTQSLLEPSDKHCP